MMLMISLWWVCVTHCMACSPQFVNDFVETHFEDSTPSKCQRRGQYCKFDRNCCAGLECQIVMQGMEIKPSCQYRRVQEDYVELTIGPTWKDYQEMESSEEERTKSLNLNELQQRNTYLKKQIKNLRELRKLVKNQQLKSITSNLEQAEIDDLREEKLNYEKKLKEETDRLRQEEMNRQLEDLERQEVNRTMAKNQTGTDLYKRLLSDLMAKDGGFLHL